MAIVSDPTGASRPLPAPRQPPDAAAGPLPGTSGAPTGTRAALPIPVPPDPPNPPGPLPEPIIDGPCAPGSPSAGPALGEREAA